MTLPRERLDEILGEEFASRVLGEIGPLETRMTSAQVSWYFSILGLNSARRRVEREGLTEEAAGAFARAQASLTRALDEIDQEFAGVVAACRPHNESEPASGDTPRAPTSTGGSSDDRS